MSGQQQLIAAGGAGLVVMNFWAGPQRKTIADGLFTKDASVTQQKAAHKVLTSLAASVLFIAVATVLGGLSSSWGRGLVTVILGLYLLFFINKYAPEG